MTEKQKQFHYAINFITGVAVVLVLSMIVALGRPPVQGAVRAGESGPIRMRDLQSSEITVPDDYEGARRIYCQYAFVCDDSLDRPLVKQQPMNHNGDLS